MRKSFIIHIDSLSVLSELTDEQAGQLFKAISCYQLTGESGLKGMMRALFIPFQNQFERDQAKYQKVCERNQNNGLTGGRPPKKKTQNNPVGLLETQHNPNKLDNDSDSKNDSKSKSIIAPPDGVSLSVWSDFVSHRKAKKANITETALKGFKREADKAGITLEAAIEMCVLRGWTGFQADWLKNGHSQPVKSAEPPRRKFNPNDED